MIKVIKISLAVIVVNSLLVGANIHQKYDIKSAKILYKISGSGDIMGVVTKATGEKSVVFDDFGAKELIEEKRENSSSIGGDNKVDTLHTITYRDKSLVSIADMEKKRITYTQNIAIDMMGASTENTAQQIGKNMMLQMGGQKIGTDTILGYKCDVWSMMGTKQCLYKGIVLKIETDIMGIKSSEVATKITFDITTDKSTFALPNFPIYDIEGNKIDKSELLKDAKEASKERVHTMPKNLLSQMKAKLLSQESTMVFAKKCLRSANSLKEANICNQKANRMSGESEEDFEEWDKATKKEILGFIDQGLDQIECMKKAKNMGEAQYCIPQE